MKRSTLFGKILLIGVVALSCHTGFAQTSSSSNETIIKTYYTAFEKKDWNSMEQILATGFTFSSPLDDHIDVTDSRKGAGQIATTSKNSKLQRSLSRETMPLSSPMAGQMQANYSGTAIILNLKTERSASTSVFLAPE